ncbi:ABC transporter permease subunit [Candidatus Thorarchaeota archaeon]|nr:MAG: ABC transporter permease subunit [Candidatus Thorarchaeota archaeon]
MESETQFPDIQDEIEKSTAVSIFTLIQIVFVMLGLILGGIIFVGGFVYTIQGWMGSQISAPGFLNAWGLQSLIIIVLTFFLLRANQGVMERSPDSFGTSFYLYILLAAIYLTMGLIGLIFNLMIIVQLIFMFLPSVRFFWFDEFQEDTKPRIKETRFTLHLIRKSPLVVVGILIISFMVGVALAAPWIATYDGETMVFKDARLPPGSPSNDIKQNYLYFLENSKFDPAIMPDYYYKELIITEVHLETIEIPRLFIGVSDLNTGNDQVSVNVTFQIYNLNQTEYDSMTASERLSYLYTSVSVVDGNLLNYIYLPNEEGVYIWELQFIASQKTSTWTANTRVVLAYYSNYPIHIWGTDNFGGDVYSRIIWGAQKDLMIAVSVVLVALTVGAVLGAASGYFGGKFDELMMRITDIFFAFPGLILAMAIVMAIGVRSLETISIALMVTWWPTYARLVRGQVLSEREKLYIEAARSSGASDTRILFNHILPNTIQPVVVQATMDIGSVLLVAAGLAFIGFGPPAGTAEWGMMIARGQNFILSSPWMTLYPGLAILVTALAFNLVGDGIRDIMDPKLRRR